MSVAPETTVLSASLAAAIAAVIERRRALTPAPDHYAEFGPCEHAFEEALDALQMRFETEFPK